jgi:hypothetical protein
MFKQQIEQLKNGEVVKFRPSGTSMTGMINHRDLVTVVPVTNITSLSIGDAVLYKVNGKHYLHKILKVTKDRFQIGSNRGRINSWTSRRNIFGKVIKVE